MHVDSDLDIFMSFVDDRDGQNLLHTVPYSWTFASTSNQALQALLSESMLRLDAQQGTYQTSVAASLPSCFCSSPCSSSTHDSFSCLSPAACWHGPIHTSNSLFSTSAHHYSLISFHLAGPSQKPMAINTRADICTVHASTDMPILVTD